MDSGVQHHRGRRGPHHWLPPSCLALVAAVTLAGCGAHARHSQAAPPSKATPTVTQARFGEADWYCLNARERSAMFPLDGPGHERLAALSIGTGRVAVILAHQSGGSLCQWWPYARSLAARFRVVAIDFDGSGASPSGGGDYPGEIVAASWWARHHGSRQIVLMGGSMGGNRRHSSCRRPRTPSRRRDRFVRARPIRRHGRSRRRQAGARPGPVRIRHS